MKNKVKIIICAAVIIGLAIFINEYSIILRIVENLTPPQVDDYLTRELKERMWIVPFFTKYSFRSIGISDINNKLDDYVPISSKEGLKLVKAYVKALNKESELRFNTMLLGVPYFCPSIEFKIETPFATYILNVTQVDDSLYLASVCRIQGENIVPLYYSKTFSLEKNEEIWKAFAKVE